jgi:hypothetical protein
MHLQLLLYVVLLASSYHTLKTPLKHDDGITNLPLHRQTLQQWHLLLLSRSPALCLAALLSLARGEWGEGMALPWVSPPAAELVD